MGLIRKHIYVIIVPGEEEKEHGVETVFKEVMAEKSSTSDSRSLENAKEDKLKEIHISHILVWMTSLWTL